MYLAEVLEENVYYYKDVIKDSQKLINLIEELDGDESIQEVIPKWSPWLSSSKDGVAFGGKKDFKSQNIDNLQGDAKEKAVFLINTIKEAVSSVSQSFFNDKNIKYEPNVSPFVGVCKYVAGCEMGAHFDAQAGDESLQYSIVLYLNDDYEGGEISFVIRDKDLRLPENDMYRPITDINDPKNKDLIDFWLKPEAGSALIFPSTEPYRHQVHVMKSGNKYIFPGFVFVEGYDPDNEEHREKYNAAAAYR